MTDDAIYGSLLGNAMRTDRIISYPTALMVLVEQYTQSMIPLLMMLAIPQHVSPALSVIVKWVGFNRNSCPSFV